MVEIGGNSRICARGAAPRDVVRYDLAIDAARRRELEEAAMLGREESEETAIARPQGSACCRGQMSGGPAVVEGIPSLEGGIPALSVLLRPGGVGELHIGRARH